MTLPAWKQYLNRKGILKAALAQGWTATDNDDYISYPLTDIHGKPWITPTAQEGRRLVLWNKQAKRPRFLFTPKTPENYKGNTPFLPDWWTPAGVWDAARNIGRVIMACGDSDLLTFFSAGAEHTITLYGEGRIPADLPQRLQQQKVFTMRYYPDRDLTGVLMACKMSLLFRRAALMGQKLEMFRLPDAVGDVPIKDINDIWVAFNCKVKPFTDQSLYASYDLGAALDDYTGYSLAAGDTGKAALAKQIQRWHHEGDLEWMRVHQEFDPILTQWDKLEVLYKPAPTLFTTPTDKKFDTPIPDGLWSVIVMAAEVYAGTELRWKADGWSQNIPFPNSPHENDRTDPAFGLNQLTYSYKDFKGGASGGWKDLCQIYGISYREFTKSKPNTTISASVQSTPIAPTAQPIASGVMSRFVSAKDVAASTVKMLRRWKNDPREVRGIRLGLSKRMDRDLHGLATEPEGDLMIVLGSTGTGKSTIVNQIALRIAQERAVFIISPEMSPEMNYLRAGVMMTGSNMGKLLAGDIEDIDLLEHQMEAIAACRDIFYLRDQCDIPLLKDIGIEVIQRKAILIVDSVQNIQTTGESWSGVEQTMMVLEGISTYTPVIGTAQTNRDSADRRDKTPQYTDVAYGFSLITRSKRFIAAHRPDLIAGIGGGKEKHVPVGTMRMRMLKDRLTGQVNQEYDLEFLQNGRYGIVGVGGERYPDLPMVIPGGH